ncbi:DEAD/DEAH box helicase [Namhaeicola litoreus]|uniref:DEAD/DEAH box helicase n=1 Tax=Namhaeicola litoreus TaxID=1052145 RepID=A0ABW3Y218_9FLAO
MENYINQIKALNNVSFQEIRKVAINDISHLNKSVRDQNYEALKRGTAIIETHDLLCQYLYSFGNMHKAKLKDAFTKLPPSVLENEFEIIDWGCGQGLGTINLFDYLSEKRIKNKVQGITLIEPSKMALERAVLHTEAYVKDPDLIKTYNTNFEMLKPDQIKIKSGHPVIHIFSNILDVAQIDLKYLANLVDGAVVSENYIISVGPLNPTNRRIDAFYKYFDVPLLYTYENSQFEYGSTKKCTYKAKIYKLENSEKGNLIPIVFYPSVQFLSSYQLDCVAEQFALLSKEERSLLKIKFDKTQAFETSAPFDIGACVYDDIHPVLAVLNNIVTRGIPTKTSPYVEEFFQEAFGYSNYENSYGTFFYKKTKEIDLLKTITWVEETIGQHNKPDFSEINVDHLQLIYSPIAIARFQKTVLEALMTGKLDVNKNKWQVLVLEKDVPCAALALKDLSYLFNNLTKLSEQYDHLTFPEIDLTIVNDSIFSKSKLHLDNRIYSVNEPLNKLYDLVVDIAVLQSDKINKDSFSKYRCENNCYFNIRSAQIKQNERFIYTTDRIVYRNIVQTNAQGRFEDVEETKRLLTYFLKLLFRKESFRSGQLPILNRALQNKSVIGLLPTGGGKSLTYQLAALLQPGVTLIVDPLKSLMKDQYDGLIKVGIDSCAFINSELSAQEKDEVATRMEQSKLQFVFLSPERLSIYSFREKLKNMHNLNVYFSYGVIDEVHCVSEWGHDFRFSYLHLGRNLYKYVRAKEGRISLFGLTATASFDVLADVERELSGNGAFPLDSETIIRYENTNRLELQYKIEKVNIDLEIDGSFDRGNKLDAKLPKAVKMPNKWDFYRAKNKFLSSYITKIPHYINELQSEESLKNIKNSYKIRQGINDLEHDNLLVNVPDDYFIKKEQYPHSGIIFCPHKGSTGISVEETKESLKDTIPALGTFMGGDDTGNLSMQNLELFRDNKQPLMVATKAFGMGIDKPNVRFTVNLNYSSSLESFVQEAGRAGRDRRIALSVILLSGYELERINKNCVEDTFPLNIIKLKWFKKEDLKQIMDHYSLEIKPDFIDSYNPQNDYVKLQCEKRNENGRNIFAEGRCEMDCGDMKCKIRHAPNLAKVWGAEKDLEEILSSNGISAKSKNIEYQNADYETVMYFYNNGFKGEDIEKGFIYSLLYQQSISVFYGDDSHSKDTNTVKGFLNSVLNSEVDQEIVSFVNYENPDPKKKIEGTDTDIAKAIYRMTCIGLIEDFTQDYANSRYRIVSKRKKIGDYYQSLKQFLLRYYAEDRAEKEIQKAYNMDVNSDDPLETEIFQCLAYLTGFVYDKISLKRKRAIDDMRTFCVSGTIASKDWKETNEDLKDFIYYYFNSKYAKTDYVADNGESYSLVVDSDSGKKSDKEILFKYLKVIDNEIVGIGTPIDNVKHLQGAVRLISRSLTDTNPTMALLEAFTLIFLGTNNNENLEKQLIQSYTDGMIEMMNRLNSSSEFWDLFQNYNSIISVYLNKTKLNNMITEALIILHGLELKKITSKYIATHE